MAKTHFRIRYALVLGLLFLAACSTPYGGPGGCLVVGSGNCTTDGKTKP